MVTNTTAAAPAPANDTDAKPAPIDQDALDAKALAKGVLARDFRPRAASIRRLAEAVLAKPKPSKKKSASGKVSGKASGKAAGKASGGKKNRKLAKIPGQKGKKKA